MDSFLNDTTLVTTMVDKMMANDWAKGMLTKKVEEAKKAKKK
jgi:hypothetical protein